MNAGLQRWWAAGCAALVSWGALAALAGPRFAELSSGAAVARVIASAAGEVLFASEVLRGREVADALRRAVVERGVRVFVLAPERAVEERASFYRSLALAGVIVRTGSAPTRAFVVVDRRHSVIGPLVQGLEPLGRDDRTGRYDDPRYVADLIRAFLRLFGQARPYWPEVAR